MIFGNKCRLAESRVKVLAGVLEAGGNKLTDQELSEKIAYELWAEMISPRPSIEDYRVRTDKEYQKESKKFAKRLINIVLKEAGGK